jgi:hypothetical protein
MIVTTEDTEDTEGWPEFYPRGPCNLRLRSSLVVDRELKPGIRREQLRDFLQPLCHLGRRQKGVIALAQVVIVHVDEQRQEIDGDGVGKAGGKIFVLVFLRIRTGSVARLRDSQASSEVSPRALF